MKSHRKQKSKITKHHLRPVSRNGKNKQENIVRLPLYEHKALHVLFGRMTPSECHRFLDIILRGGKTWTGTKLRDIREDIIGGPYANI